MSRRRRSCCCNNGCNYGNNCGNGCGNGYNNRCCNYRGGFGCGRVGYESLLFLIIPFLCYRR